MANFNVSLKKLTEKVSLDVVYTPKGLEEINVEIAEVNRPGLFLAGYYDYFDKLRLQILGLAEMNFLSGLSAEKRYERLDQLFGQQPPAVIVCRSEELEPFPEMLELAQKHGVALLRSNEMTCTLMGSLISVLNLELAPRITRHGVLVEVYGEGILILGDSGIGKSELAIELVKRGHRLVADDAVELRKVSNRQIMGTAPENIRHFIELRGIGIVNVARVFGVGAVKESESLDLVVQLEAWDPTKNYQRTGLESEYYEILGDMHNLFGDTNAVHVSVNEKGYNIEQIIDGETVAEVLDYVQYNPKKLVRTLETWVTKSVKEGKISLEEGKEFLSNYRSGLYGYTYLE